jgi:hypothetical protein
MVVCLIVMMMIICLFFRSCLESMLGMGIIIDLVPETVSH